MTRRRPVWPLSSREGSEAGVDPSATPDAPQGLPVRRMSEADDTVTGEAVVAVHACRCGTCVVVPLSGCHCHACGRAHGLEEP